tara:strand:- start:431 stop:688 length:258 start_codon:yes stop_codon:yes gene_type:complete
MKKIDPKRYNLSQRLNLQQNELNELFIIIDRQSRIIMKDGHRILKMVNRIQSIEKDRHVSVLTSAPVCSKTKTFLSNHSIPVKNL